MSAERFQEEALKLRAKLGGKHDLGRFFCDIEDLFVISGRTYALTKMWGADTISVVNEIIAQLPEESVSYTKVMDEDLA